MKTYPKRIDLVVLALCVLFTINSQVVFGATSSGDSKTWEEAADHWKIKLSTTDKLLLCINFTAVSGSIAYGAGDKVKGKRFVEMSTYFERELRKLHGDKVAELLLNATTSVMLNTVEIAGEQSLLSVWEQSNLYRCNDVMQRLIGNRDINNGR